MVKEVTAIDVAKAFVHKLPKQDLSKLKLNQLVYLAFVHHAIRTQTALFDTDFDVTRSGPQQASINYAFDRDQLTHYSIIAKDIQHVDTPAIDYVIEHFAPLHTLDLCEYTLNADTPWHVAITTHQDMTPAFIINHFRKEESIHENC